MMRRDGLRGRLARRVGRARVLVHLADHLRLPALDARLLQILHRRLRLSITIQNSHGHEFHNSGLPKWPPLINYISGAFKLPASRLRVAAPLCSGTVRVTTETNSQR